MTSLPSNSEAPWYSSYPSAKSVAPSVSISEVHQWLSNGQKPGRDFLLVDLRRVDHEGGSIRGSINLPAQSLYTTIPTLYQLFVAAGLTKIVWYCGSSKGRGTRAAGWFADFLKERNDSSMENFTMTGGIKAWAKAGQEYVEWMDEYDATKWS